MCHKGEHNKRIVHDLLAKEENNNIAMSNLLARLQKLEGLNILGVTLKENSEECLAFVKELKQEYEGLKMKIASAQEVCEMKRMREIERMNAVINEKIIEVRSDFVCRVEQCLEERIKRFKVEELPC